MFFTTYVCATDEHDNIDDDDASWNLTQDIDEEVNIKSLNPF